MNSAGAPFTLSAMVLEDRIRNEARVDAYGLEEHAMWQ